MSHTQCWFAHLMLRCTPKKRKCKFERLMLYCTPKVNLHTWKNFAHLMLSCTTNVKITPELKCLGLNRWPALNNHQTFYGSLHGILALSPPWGERNMADVPGSSFDRALNLINRAVGMLCGGNNSESQREGSSSNDVQYLPAASTSSSAGSLPAANTSNGGQ